MADPYDNEERMRRVKHLHGFKLTGIFSKKDLIIKRKSFNHSDQPLNTEPLSLITGRYIDRSEKEEREQDLRFHQSMLDHSNLITQVKKVMRNASRETSMYLSKMLMT